MSEAHLADKAWHASGAKKINGEKVIHIAGREKPISLSSATNKELEAHLSKEQHTYGTGGNAAAHDAKGKRLGHQVGKTAGGGAIHAREHDKKNFGHGMDEKTAKQYSDAHRAAADKANTHSLTSHHHSMSGAYASHARGDKEGAHKDLDRAHASLSDHLKESNRSGVVSHHYSGPVTVEDSKKAGKRWERKKSLPTTSFSDVVRKAR